MFLKKGVTASNPVVSVRVSEYAQCTCTVKAVNREDKLSRRYRDRDLAKFESSRRYRQR